MSREKIRDALRMPNKRPEHSDFARLSEILCRLDDRVGQDGEVLAEPFKQEVEKVIDRDVLAYVARERAYRVVMLMRAKRVAPPGLGLEATARLMDFMATAWIDAAVMMATFERERPKAS